MGRSNPLLIESMKVTPIIRALESFHAAQRQTDELYRIQIALRRSLEAHSSLNPHLIQRSDHQHEIVGYP